MSEKSEQTLIKFPLKYDTTAGYVRDGKGEVVLQVKGNNSEGFTTPTERQDAIGHFICEAVNNYERLKRENEELRAQLQKDWKPISEGLPEESGKYLITDSSGLVVTADFCSQSPDSPRKFYHDFINQIEANALAWRPLPPAYEGEGK